VLEALAQLFCQSLLQRPLLTKLLAHLHLILESNITVEAATNLKREMKRNLAPIAEKMRLLFPNLSEQSSFDLLI
jgi:hypothetical protein